MQLYEFVNPSDAVSFYAPNDTIAYACAIIIGNGKAGCTKFTGSMETKLHTLVAFYDDPDSIITENLGASLEDFTNTNRNEISEALKTFAYVKPNRRKEYDEACNACITPEAQEAYRKDHEDRNRTSFSKIVLYAWKAAEIFCNQPEEVPA